jgi:hypothetical protein
MTKLMNRARTTAAGNRTQEHRKAPHAATETQRRVPTGKGGPGDGTNHDQPSADGYAPPSDGALEVIARRERDVSTGYVSPVASDDGRDSIAVDMRRSGPQAPDHRRRYAKSHDSSRGAPLAKPDGRRPRGPRDRQPASSHRGVAGNSADTATVSALVYQRFCRSDIDPATTPAPALSVLSHVPVTATPWVS